MPTDDIGKTRCALELQGQYVFLPWLPVTRGRIGDLHRSYLR